jgi:hypothetical protein
MTIAFHARQQFVSHSTSKQHYQRLMEIYRTVIERVQVR